MILRLKRSDWLIPAGALLLVFEGVNLICGPSRGFGFIGYLGVLLLALGLAPRVRGAAEVLSGKAGAMRILRIAAAAVLVLALLSACFYLDDIKRFYGAICFALAFLCGLAAVTIPPWQSADSAARGRVMTKGILWLIVAVPCAVALAQVERQMWGQTYAPGSIGNYGFGPASVHIVLIIFLGVLAIHAFRARYRENLAYCVGAFSALPFAVVSFARTIPRSGGEGVMLWFFLAPAFFLAACALFAAAVAGVISALSKRRKESAPHP